MTHVISENEPIDLRTARPGCEAAFRCGGKAKLRRTVAFNGHTDVEFAEETTVYAYCHDGRRWKHYGESNFDIVAITAPPLTEAERLAEIVKIIMKIDERGTTYEGDMLLLRDILGLAEGRSL